MCGKGTVRRSGIYKQAVSGRYPERFGALGPEPIAGLGVFTRIESHSLPRRVLLPLSALRADGAQQEPSPYQTRPARGDRLAMVRRVIANNVVRSVKSPVFIVSHACAPESQIRKVQFTGNCATRENLGLQ